MGYSLRGPKESDTTWNRHMLKSVKDYEKRIRKAIFERRKTVDSWLDLDREDRPPVADARPTGG